MSDNPLLERARIPGERFSIPSLGIFYTNGELSEDTESGEIYLYPMTTLDELLLKTPDQLFNGESIEKIFKRCSPNILKPLELLSKDVDYILTCLRKISFGEFTLIDYKHDCKNAEKHEYSINVSKFISSTKKLDPTRVEKDYVKTLSNDQVIRLIPPRFQKTLKIYQAAMNNDEISPESLTDDVLDSIASMIQEVDGIKDFNMIKEWLGILTPLIIKEISGFVMHISEWGPDFSTIIKCKDCGEDINISSEINPIRFFFST